MAGARPEILLEIGKLISSVRNLETSMADNRKEADRRHLQNTERLDKIDDRLAPMVSTVTKMEPVVKDYETNRNKALGILIAFSAIASAFGFFASELKGWLFGK